MKGFGVILSLVFMVACSHHSHDRKPANHSVDKDVTGDTVGAALTNLSDIEEGVDRALKMKVRLLKADLCAEIGTLVGHAFAVQTEIKLYTHGAKGDYKIADLIDSTTTLRNDYCVNKIITSEQAKASLENVKSVVANVRSKLELLNQK